MSTESTADAVGSFLQRAKREMADAAAERLVTLRSEEAQLRATVDLAQSLKPGLVLEAQELMLRVQAERTGIEAALEQLAMPLPEPPKAAEPPRAQEPPKAPEPAREATPPAKPASQRTAVPQPYLDEVEAIASRVASMTALAQWDPGLYFELRRVVASVRDLIAKGRGHKASVTVGRLEGMLEDVFAWYSGLDRPAGFVYGFSREHHGGNEGWAYLSSAYRHLEDAIDAWATLEANNFRLQGAADISSLCWLAQATFRRVCNRHGMSLAEPRQEELRDAVKDAARQRLMPEPDAGHVQDVDAAFARLGGLRDAVQRAVRSARTADGRELALNALEEAATSGDLAPLTRLAAGALDAGVPPSDKRLRGLLVPHLDALRGSGVGGHFAKLIEYLEADAGASDEGEDAPGAAGDDVTLQEEEYRAQAAAVRLLVEGKRVLFLGGNRDPEKCAALEKELGLAELDWPQTTAATKLGFFLERVPRADVVVRLSRFSRKAYKEASAEAKRQGKMCVTLAGGLGLHNLVSQMHQQLVPRR